MNRRAFRLACRIRELTESYDWMTGHAGQLNKNWDIYNEMNLDAFRAVLDMPDADIPDMLAKIKTLQAWAGLPSEPGVN
jgi:succinate dehydrogenase flavin-adding protein (antitoxin of CptAB toxin-antitoxin module)